MIQFYAFHVFKVNFFQSHDSVFLQIFRFLEYKLFPIH